MPKRTRRKEASEKSERTRLWYEALEAYVLDTPLLSAIEESLDASEPGIPHGKHVDMLLHDIVYNVTLNAANSGKFPPEALTDNNPYAIAVCEKLRAAVGPDVEPKTREIPDDLVTLHIATREFKVDRTTLLRGIRRRKLRSYRPAGASPNAPHLVSRSELAQHYPRIRRD